MTGAGQTFAVQMDPGMRRTITKRGDQRWDNQPGARHGIKKKV